MENNVFKHLLKAVWVALMFACCQMAAAAVTASVTATPNNPTAPAAVTLGVAITSDAEPVSVTQVEYFNRATSLGTVLQAPFMLVLDNVAAGTYEITAKVTTTDANNPVLQSAPIQIVVAAPAGSATAYFIHTDQLNTPRAITNGTGTIVWQWDSDPFGKDAPNEQPAGQAAFVFNQRFPGQYFDRETNQHYNVHRDYDPQTGRYVQSDPIGLHGGINTYGYVSGNPLSLSDPSGLCPFCLVIPAVCAGGACEAGLVFIGGAGWFAANRPQNMSRIEERHFDRTCINTDDPCRNLKENARRAIAEARTRWPQWKKTLRSFINLHAMFPTRQ